MPPTQDTYPYILNEAMFVEGFPYDFSVEKQNSHAWVEVWFDDFGWLAFEPTSRYPSQLVFGYADNYSDLDFENVEMIEPVNETKSYTFLFVILGSAFSIALILVIVIRIYTISKRTVKEKIVMQWEKIKKIYYKKRKLTKENETAREFYNRADKHNTNLKAASHIYESTVFSSQDTEQSQLIEINELYKKIKIDIRNLKKNK